MIYRSLRRIRELQSIKTRLRELYPCADSPSLTRIACNLEELLESFEEVAGSPEGMHGNGQDLIGLVQEAWRLHT
jgi:hypothetical protein